MLNELNEEKIIGECGEEAASSICDVQLWRVSMSKVGGRFCPADSAWWKNTAEGRPLY
jgi:hypothetical protein